MKPSRRPPFLDPPLAQSVSVNRLNEIDLSVRKSISPNIDFHAMRNKLLFEEGDTKLTHGQATCLLRKELTAEVVDSYLVLRRGDQLVERTVYLFGSSFFQDLINGKEAPLVKGLFDKRAALIPLSLGEHHWALCMVDFKYRCVCYYDPAANDGQYVLGNVKDYLQRVHFDHPPKGYPLGLKLPDDWKTYDYGDRVPQIGENDPDAGVLVCWFADRLMNFFFGLPNQSPTLRLFSDSFPTTKELRHRMIENFFNSAYYVVKLAEEREQARVEAEERRKKLFKSTRGFAIGDEFVTDMREGLEQHN